MFLDELQIAKFLSPVVIDPVPVPDENGRVTIARDAKVQFPMLSTEDGRKFFMAFTDWTELKRRRDEENQQTFAMNFDDYAGMLLRKDAQGNISLTDKQTGIHFDCDSVEVKGNERTAYVNGSMVFTQDNLRITADNGSFNWKTKNAVFSGNVTVNGTPHTGDLTYNVRDKKFL